MVYVYSLEIPLEYNKYSLYDSRPDSEFQIEIDSELVWTLNFAYSCYGNNGVVKEFKGPFTIRVKAVKEDTGRGNILYSRLVCTIDDYIAESTDYACDHMERLVSLVCKHLTFEINKHNCNRQRYQPRIEANWGKVHIKKVEEYEPYVQYLEEQRNIKEPGVIHVNDGVHISDSVYLVVTQHIDSTKIDYSKWICDGNYTIDFLLDEYYFALGEESVTSKFFHLFTIIEFIEAEYKDKSSAKQLFSEEEKEQIISAVKHLLVNDSTKMSDDNKNKSAKLVSKVGQFMSETTDIGRIKKLKNILSWLGIESIKIHEQNIEVTTDFLEKIVKLRNKSFHGNRDIEAEYIKRVEELLYLCEKVIEGIEKLEAF